MGKEAAVEDLDSKALRAEHRRQHSTVDDEELRESNRAVPGVGPGIEYPYAREKLRGVPTEVNALPIRSEITAKTMPSKMRRA